MGSKFLLIAVLLVAVSVGLEAFPVAIHDGLYEDDYEMDYPDDEDDAAGDDNDGNELRNVVNDSVEIEDSRDALDEMGLEDPHWGRTLRLPRPRDRHPRSPRSRGKKPKRKRPRRRGGKKKARLPRPWGKKKGKK